jgi:hypothetical protein
MMKKETEYTANVALAFAPLIVKDNYMGRDFAKKDKKAIARAIKPKTFLSHFIKGLK